MILFGPLLGLLGTLKQQEHLGLDFIIGLVAIGPSNILIVGYFRFFFWALSSSIWAVTIFWTFIQISLNIFFGLKQNGF